LESKNYNIKTPEILSQAFQHLNDGNLFAAGPLFEQVLAQEPQNFAALNGHGFIALQQNALPKAQADLQASLSINPKQPFAHKMLGIVLGAMGQLDAAMEAFAAALVLDAKDAEVYFNRANFLFRRVRHKKRWLIWIRRSNSKARIWKHDRTGRIC
jgi:protein O-GlcNAc transferase